jgi:hypothetical protein
LRERRRRHQIGLRDLFRPQAAHLAQRQRHLRVGRQRRMAAGEDQPQPIILDTLFVGPGVGRNGDLLCGTRFVELIEPRLPAQAVNRLEAARRHQPRPRIPRHSLARPLLECGSERVVQRFLGGVEVAEQTDERREHAPRFGDVDSVDGLVDGIDRGHGRRSHHLHHRARNPPRQSNRRRRSAH